MRKKLISILLILVVFISGACRSDPAPELPGGLADPSGAAPYIPDAANTPTRFRAVFFELFDTVTIVMGYADSQQEFDYYTGVIHSELYRLHMLFDIFHEYPGVSNIRTINQNAGVAPVEVDPVIIELIQLSKQAYRSTNGSVNIALGPVLGIWHTHRNAPNPALPDMAELLAANEFTSIDDVIVDEENSTVFLRREGMSLDVGTIGKGFAIELAAHRAIDAGFESFLLNVGGDVFAANAPPGRDFWNVGVEDPNLDDQNIVDVVAASSLAVFSSGDYRRYFVVDGVSYSHLIDPQTLTPAVRYRAVTVIHPRAAYAEILSTAAFIMDLDSATALLEDYGAQAIWILDDGQTFTTPGYETLSGGSVG